MYINNLLYSSMRRVLYNYKTSDLFHSQDSDMPIFCPLKLLYSSYTYKCRYQSQICPFLVLAIRTSHSRINTQYLTFFYSHRFRYADFFVVARCASLINNRVELQLLINFCCLRSLFYYLRSLLLKSVKKIQWNLCCYNLPKKISGINSLSNALHY